MLALRRPSPSTLERDAARLPDLARTGGGGGAAGSRDEAIGWGLKRFERAVHALKRLEQFNVPGTRVEPAVRATEGVRAMVVGLGIAMIVRSVRIV